MTETCRYFDSDEWDERLKRHVGRVWDVQDLVEAYKDEEIDVSEVIEEDTDHIFELDMDDVVAIWRGTEPRGFDTISEYCPHEVEEDGLCVFHLPVSEKDDGETKDELLKKIEQGGKENKYFIGARFEELDLAHEVLESEDDNNPIDFRFAEIDELNMDGAIVRQPWYISRSTIGKSYFPRTVFEGVSYFRRAKFRGKLHSRHAEFREVSYFSGAEFGGGVDFRRAEFGGESYFYYAKFRGGSSFSNAEFGGESHFRNAEFRGVSYFSGAEFGRDSDFSDAEFRGKSYFRDAEFGRGSDFRYAEFGGYSSFRYAEFEGKSYFNDAEFGGNSNFRLAEFRGVSYFSSAEFEASSKFRRAEFERKSHFYDAKFRGSSNFRYAEFGEGSKFRQAEFRGVSYFRHAKFRGDSDFRRAEFGRGSYFSDTEFEGDSDFSDAKFRGESSFINAKFEGDSDFSDTEFGGGSDFKRAEFRGDSDFTSAEFRESSNFNRAEFEGDSDFQRVEFSGDSAFLGAKFKGGSSFIRTKFGSGSDFRGAEFKGGYSDFHDAEFNEWISFAESTLNNAIFRGTVASVIELDDATIYEGEIQEPEDDSTFYDFTGTTFGDVTIRRRNCDHDLFDYFRVYRTDFDGFDFTDYKDELGSKPEIHEFGHNSDDELEETPAGLEATYLKAKDGAKKVGDHELASKFFIKEMQYRRDRYKDEIENEDLDWKRRAKLEFDRRVNWLYEMTSGYGEKPIRVILTSLSVVVLFTFLYPFWGIRQTGDGTARTLSYASASAPAEFLDVIAHSSYFSSVTFTTLGYGDLHPVGFSRILSMVQSATGALLIALLIFVFGRSVKW